MIKAVITSNTECCFKNMVANMMDTDKVKQSHLIHFLEPSLSLCTTANKTPKELYTWILGHRLVEVSILYKKETKSQKTLSLGMINGLR